MPSERIESGIPGLDKLIQGGFVKNSINLVAGQTGAGKTIFCTQYLLHGLRKGEKGLYISLGQEADEILADVASFGWDVELKKFSIQGKFSLISLEPSSIEDLIVATAEAVRKLNPVRLVLDSLSVAEMGWKMGETDVSKVRSQVFSYMKTIKKLGLTSLLITEIPETDVRALSRFGFEEFIADAVITLHYLEYAIGTLNRSLIIRKMRRTDHGADVYPMRISNKGIDVKPLKTVRDRPLNI